MDLDVLIPEHTPCTIPDLPLPPGMRILVLAPHPDDFDEVAVTLASLMSKGHTITVAVARTGSGVEDCYRPGLSLAGKADLREEEQQRSARFFGLPPDRLTFMSLANDAEDQPVNSTENADAIESLLRKQTPDVVFMPHYSDTNSGHRAMYSLFVRAVQRFRRQVTVFLNRDPKTISMRIDLYMPFGQKEAEWKAKLLRFHDSQHQRNLHSRGHGFDDRILEVNRKAAQELSLSDDYAEAFQVEIGNDSL